METLLFTIVYLSKVVILFFSLYNYTIVVFGDDSSGFLFLRIPFLLLLSLPLLSTHLPEFIFYIRLIQSNATEYCFLYSIAMLYYFLLPVLTLLGIHIFCVINLATVWPEMSTEIGFIRKGYDIFPDKWMHLSNTFNKVVIFVFSLGVGLGVGFLFISPRECSSFNELPIYTVTTLVLGLTAVFYHNYRYLIHTNFEVNQLYLYSPMFLVLSLAMMFLISLLFLILEEYTEAFDVNTLRKIRFSIHITLSFLVKCMSVVLNETFFVESKFTYPSSPVYSRIGYVYRHRVMLSDPSTQAEIWNRARRESRFWKFAMNNL